MTGAEKHDRSKPTRRHHARVRQPLAQALYARVAKFRPHAERIMGDLPNFTDSQPLVQISEVKLAP